MMVQEARGLCEHAHIGAVKCGLWRDRKESRVVLRETRVTPLG